MGNVRPQPAMILVLILAAGLAAQKPSRPNKGKPEATGDPVVEGEVGKALDAAMREIDVVDGGFCGVVLVASRGKVLLRKGYGLADAAAGKEMPADALFDWASVTKQFTAGAALRLIDLSRLPVAKLEKQSSRSLAKSIARYKNMSLEDPLSRFFPDVPKDKAAVTLRQLLDHTSGIEAGFKAGWDFDSRERDSFVRFKLARPMTSKPGEKFEYSNSGYALVAAIIEQVTGSTFEAFCIDQVFGPAGMKTATMIGRPELDLGRVPKIARGTGFTDRPKDFVFAYGNRLTWGYRGCGGVVASTLDLYAWDRALRDPKFLSKDLLEEYYRPALENYALGWEIRKAAGGRRTEHSGGVLGVVTYYMRHLELDYCVALACSYEPKTHPQVIAEKLATIVTAGK